MDAQTCLKKLGYVGVLSFATTDGEGNPQVRNISAIHYEPDAIYFFTARGKDFCRRTAIHRKGSDPRLHHVQGDDPAERQSQAGCRKRASKMDGQNL